MDLIELVGWAASATTVATYTMKTMLPLRIAAIASSTLFILYSVPLGLWPLLGMELVLLPLNIWRLTQLIHLQRRVAHLRRTETPDFSVLKAGSRARAFAAGEVIFNRGDAPDALYYIESGEVALEELAITLDNDQIFGEIAFFIDAQARTATARCASDCKIHVIDEKTFMRLYFQDPAFGMSIMKTITRRLIESVERKPEVFLHSFAEETSRERNA